MSGEATLRSVHATRPTHNQRRATKKTHIRPQEPLERALTRDKERKRGRVRKADEGEEENKRKGVRLHRGRQGEKKVGMEGGRLGDRRGTAKQ